MPTLALRAGAIVLTALALAPGVAHVAALPNKVGLARDAYFAAQGLYRGWALFGVAMVGALVVDGALAWALRRARRARGLAGAGALAMALSLVAFFLWTFPTNQATANWTLAPADWRDLRWRWEFGHAVGAACAFAALVCVTLAALRASEPD